MLLLEEFDPDSWLPSSKVVLVLVIVGVAVCCVCLKVVFVVWLWRLEWRQQLYLGLLGDESYTADIETALQVSVADLGGGGSRFKFSLLRLFLATS